MISSTARDLPEHRKEVLDACLRQGMFPMMMKHLPASDTEAISASIEMVDEADIYVGVFAHRYGYVPTENNPQQTSITEMEYNRAVERKIPRLIFIADKNQSLADFTINDIDTGEAAAKLAKFKSQIGTENIVNFFKSPEDLRAHVINSLSQLRQSDLATFHYVSDIPQVPEAFIAHPYTLLQTHQLVGRQSELNQLTDWVSRPDLEIYKARILNIIAIGGLGKSALTWKWFNDIAPQEMKPLAGRIWWSFYESDASFENFVTRALAYVTRQKLNEMHQIPAPERESQLLAVLDREPLLLVLDGFERMLVAYSRMDAARLDDSQIGNQRSLRKTADPGTGRFLKKLAQVKSSRILVSTRLYPAELETEGEDPIPGSFKQKLAGLIDEDAVELWRAFNVAGARDLLLPIFATFDKHPLLIQVLAGEVKRYRSAPGNFEEWRKSRPQFDPIKFPRMQDAMSHVLEFALRGLDDKARQTLQIIAAFRMPARYDTLSALLMGNGNMCADERELDKVLTELEDRGLLGWDKRANRYDLHPIVRGVVWRGLDEDTRHGIYISLHAHFEALPMIDDYRNVNSLEDITPAIELYNTLIGLKRYDDAAEFFSKRLNRVAFYRVNVNSQVVELLKMLFPSGLEQSIQLPLVSNVSTQADTLIALADAYGFTGNQQLAISLYHLSNDLCEQHGDLLHLTVGLEDLALALCTTGDIYESEIAARKSILIARNQNDKFREARGLRILGAILASRGNVTDAKIILHKAKQAFIEQRLSDLKGTTLNHKGASLDHIAWDHWEGATLNHIARYTFWVGDPIRANELAKNAWELVNLGRCEPCSMTAKRLEGLTALALQDVDIANKCLHSVLQHAREVNLPREELEALIGLADVRRFNDDFKSAQELLDDVWAVAKSGPYRLIHADACNVLTQIERDKGDQAAAVEAATRAFLLAWCDGPPFAYYWGLEKARKHLWELGATEPQMPSFNESKFELMPDIKVGSRLRF
jgi:tetratricopeptide (TPR) repeat protein